MWSEGMGETWLQYRVVKDLLPGSINRASEGIVTVLMPNGGVAIDSLIHFCIQNYEACIENE